VVVVGHTASGGHSPADTPPSPPRPAIGPPVPVVATGPVRWTPPVARPTSPPPGGLSGTETFLVPSPGSYPTRGRDDPPIADATRTGRREGGDHLWQWRPRSPPPDVCPTPPTAVLRHARRPTEGDSPPDAALFRPTLPKFSSARGAAAVGEGRKGERRGEERRREEGRGGEGRGERRLHAAPGAGRRLPTADAPDRDTRRLATPGRATGDDTSRRRPPQERRSPRLHPRDPGYYGQVLERRVNHRRRRRAAESGKSRWASRDGEVPSMYHQNLLTSPSTPLEVDGG
jgi:hypothetical protein